MIIHARRRAGFTRTYNSMLPRPRGGEHATTSHSRAEETWQAWNDLISDDDLREPRRKLFPYRNEGDLADEHTLKDEGDPTVIRNRVRLEYLFSSEYQWRLPLVWESTINLPAWCNVHQCLRIMRATAAQSRRSKKPVYHFAIYFKHVDSTKIQLPQLKDIAKYTLKCLGLEDNQAIVVTPVPRSCWTINILVNLVNPKTLTSSPLSFDYLTLSRAAENIEKQYGLANEKVRIFNNLVRKRGGFEKYAYGSIASPGYSFDDVQEDMDYIEEIARSERNTHSSGMHWVALRDYFWRRGYVIEIVGNTPLVVNRATGVHIHINYDDRTTEFLLRKYEEWTRWRRRKDEEAKQDKQ